MRKARLIASAGSLLIRLLYATLRVRIEDHSGALNPEAAGVRQIWLFWHNRLFMIPPFVERRARFRKGAALTSASKDGDLMAAFLENFGVRAIRGSSSRRGGLALLELASALEQGYVVAITPDGPRGPRYKLNRGVVLLAQKTRAEVVPVSIEYGKFWQLKSWDGFMIPKPFTTAEISIGEPIPVRETSSEDEFEAERLRIERALTEPMKSR